MKKVLAVTGALGFGLAGHAAIVYFEWPVGSGGNGHRYGLTETALSWTAAEAVAVAEGGHLASIGSAAEESFLTSTFGSRRFWIGFTDAASEGTWLWSDGSPVTYLNWDAGEPNNLGDEDYAVMNWSGVSWNDLRDLSDYTYGIVELAAIPEPRAYAVLAAGLLVGFGSGPGAASVLVAGAKLLRDPVRTRRGAARPGSPRHSKGPGREGLSTSPLFTAQPSRWSVYWLSFAS